MNGKQNHQIEFTGCRPVFFVSDLPTSLKFYVDALGFKEGWNQQDQISNPDDQHRITLCYVFCSHFELLLHEVENPHAGEVVVGCATKELVDRAYVEYQRRGTPVEEPPQLRPRGCYEMQIVDPDGNRLRILTNA